MAAIHAYGETVKTANFFRKNRQLWTVYLQTLSQILPYMAASGHNNYTKCLTLFLGKVSTLHLMHPHIEAKFEEGYFVLRRSAKYWAALFADLFIEQVLMGSLKSRGGLTRGRGMTERTRLLWCLYMPACGKISKSVQTLTDTSQSEELPKDLSVARRKCDSEDVQMIIDMVSAHSPFSRDQRL